MSNADPNITNSRILTLDGKSSGGTKYSGFTIKDRYTGNSSAEPVNLIQLTMIPTGISTMQNHRFIMGSSLTGDDTNSPDSNAVGTDSTNGTSISIVPDLTLVSGRFYQFKAYLTIIIQPAVNDTFLCGHYEITSAIKDTSLIGGGYGYRVDTISSETGIDTYIDETKITLDANVSNPNQLTIKITPGRNIIFSIDLLADIHINSARFSP
jgi:hypothetical protein